ncbi:MAG: sulfate permease [Spongiibacteraceae bacterium]
MKIAVIFPCIDWIKQYNRGSFSSDLVASIIVSFMLIPQALAYAILAGLPAEVGLYASILPLTVYAIFGTSKTLSVGPVAITSLMTAAAIQGVASQQAVDPVNAAMILALLSGFFLSLLGLLRLGFLANFLSQPVVSGFITASSIIIALSQFKYILGISASGDNLPDLIQTLVANIHQTNKITLITGSCALIFLFWARHYFKPLLIRFCLSEHRASLLAKTAPVLIVVITSLAAYQLGLADQGLALVGKIPQGLPALRLPVFNPALWLDLLVPAILISIIGYVSSISVGKTLGAKKRQKINPDQELIGLGASNIMASLAGGLPVTGGFSRSAVNLDAGAVTQAASVFTAIGVTLVTFTMTGLLAFLPKATLAATIIVAVLGLVDFSILKKSWDYSLSDFIAVALTMTITLLIGVELGVMCGVISSIALHLYKTSKPHIAEVGEIGGTEHFRNVKRHQVQTHPSILSLRIDESLYFANASFLEDEILKNIEQRKALKHIVLMCTAINEIDLSALEVLKSLNHQLKKLHISFNLSEVKGPVMDTLKKTDFISQLNGQIFLSQHMAIKTLVEQELLASQNHPDFKDFQI